MVRFELGKEIEKDGITSVGQNKNLFKGPMRNRTSDLRIPLLYHVSFVFFFLCTFFFVLILFTNMMLSKLLI